MLALYLRFWTWLAECKEGCQKPMVLYLGFLQYDLDIFFLISCLTRNAFQVASICVYLDYGACFVKSRHRLIWIVKLFPLLKLYGADKSTPFIFYFFFYDGDDYLAVYVWREQETFVISGFFFLEPDSGYQVVTEKTHLLVRILLNPSLYQYNSQHQRSHWNPSYTALWA